MSCLSSSPSFMGPIRGGLLRPPPTRCEASIVMSHCLLLALQVIFAIDTLHSIGIFHHLATICDTLSTLRVQKLYLYYSQSLPCTSPPGSRYQNPGTNCVGLQETVGGGRWLIRKCLVRPRKKKKNGMDWMLVHTLSLGSGVTCA